MTTTAAEQKTAAQTAWLTLLELTVSGKAEIEAWIEDDGMMGVAMTEDECVSVCHVDRTGQMLGHWL
jgi:hypothetical protein